MELGRGLRAVWTQHRFAILLLAVLLVGGFAQTEAALHLWATQDEGQYIQAAMAITKGGIPDVTFPARPEPLLPAVLAPVMLVFGGSLLAARELLVAVDIGTALTLALLTRRICHRYRDAAALATAGVYLLSPFAVGTLPTVIEEPLAALFLSLGFFFLLRDLWASWTGNLLLAGLFLGLAVLARRSALAVAVLWLLWLLFSQSTWRARVVTFLKLYLPPLAVVGGYFLYVAYRTSFAWTLTVYTSVYLPYGQTISPLTNRIEIFGYLFLVAAPLLIAPVALLLRILREQGRNSLALAASITAAISLTFLLASYPVYADWGLGELVIYSVGWLILTVTALLWILLTGESVSSPAPSKSVRGDHALLFAGWGIGILLLDFTPRPQAFAVYAGDALAPFAVLFGLWFITLIPRPETRVSPSPSPSSRRRRNRWTPYLFPTGVVFLLIASSALSAVLVLGPSNPNNVAGAYGLPSHTVDMYPPSEVSQVGTFLRSSMGPKDTIFTFDSAYVAEGNRMITPPIAQFLDPYIHFAQSGMPVNESPYPTAPAGMLPSMQGLLSDWNRTNLTWFIEGPVTKSTLAHAPLLAWYLNRFYYPVTSFGDPMSYDLVTIFHRGVPPPPEANPIASASVPGGPVATVASGGVLYVASLNAPYLYLLGENGTQSRLSLPFPGARSLAIYYGDLWIGSTLTSQVEILPLETGGKAEVLTVGSGPSVFSADTSTQEVFVGTVTSKTVTAIQLTANKTWWHIVWTVHTSFAVTGLAVFGAQHRLYAALPDSNQLLVLSDKTGKVVGEESVGFSPFSLQVMDGSLLASAWIGAVYKLSLTSPDAPQVLGSVDVGQNLTQVLPVFSLNALAISSQGDDSVYLLNARSLYLMGAFHRIPCSSSVAWDSVTGDLGTANVCKNRAWWWNLTSPDNVSLVGPSGTEVYLGSGALGGFPLPLNLTLWPQKLTLNTRLSGHLPGLLQTTLTSGGQNLTLVLRVGPSLAGIQALQTRFTEEVAVASVLAFVSTLLLLSVCRGEEMGPSPPPVEDPAAPPTRAAVDPSPGTQAKDRPGDTSPSPTPPYSET